MSTSAPAVLVVDDHPDLLVTIKRILERGNFQATYAETGKDALRRLQEQPYQVVLTDMFMPDVDGMEIIAAVRKYQPRAYVIAVSGGGSYMSSPEALNIAVKLGADESLPKPFTPMQLLEAVQRAAGRN